MADTPGLRHALTAAENAWLRAAHDAALDDVALLMLRLHLAPYVVLLGPSPRPRIPHQRRPLER